MHCVGGIFNTATVVGHSEIRVVIFAVRQPGDGIDEGDGLIIVLETVGLAEQLVMALPSIQLWQQLLDLVWRKRRRAAGAWQAVLVEQRGVAHGRIYFSL